MAGPTRPAILHPAAKPTVARCAYLRGAAFSRGGTMRKADAVVIVDTLSRQLSATTLSAKDAMFSGECDAARRDPGN